MLSGQDPRDITRHWENFYSGVRGHYALDRGHVFPILGRRGITISAISGIDIALWDLLGKSLNAPVWRLLGGRRHKRMPAYASGGWAPAALLLLASRRLLMTLRVRVTAMAPDLAFWANAILSILVSMKSRFGMTGTLMPYACIPSVLQRTICPVFTWSTLAGPTCRIKMKCFQTEITSEEFFSTRPI